MGPNAEIMPAQKLGYQVSAVNPNRPKAFQERTSVVCLLDSFLLAHDRDPKAFDLRQSLLADAGRRKHAQEFVLFAGQQKLEAW